jgi:hypothetical protein
MNESIKIRLIDFTEGIVNAIAYIFIFMCLCVFNFLPINDDDVFNEKGIDVYNWFQESFVKLFGNFLFSFLFLVFLYSIKYLIKIRVLKISSPSDIKSSFIFALKLIIPLCFIMAILFYVIKPWF